MSDYLSHQLEIDSCPHCGRANPTVVLQSQHFITKNHSGSIERWWGIYKCNSCGGVITAWAPMINNTQPDFGPIVEIYPDIPTISDANPEKPREFLRQAQDSLHAPAGAIMLSASAIDAMLKEKGYKKGDLYPRIEEAAKNHLITDEMSKWAHQVRLDSNEQRRADEDASLPTNKDAKLTFDFAVAFAEYLFVLPSKVSRGITDTTVS